LGGRAIGRDVLGRAGGYQLWENVAFYGPLFRLEKVDIGSKNAYFLEINHEL